MERSGKLLVVSLVALAVPAGAQTFGFSIGSALTPACFSIGNATYRIANDARADYTVRIDPSAKSPDIRIQLAAAADEADFVLVDDGDAAPVCHGASGVRSVRIDTKAAAPDLTVGFANSSTTPDYRIYVRSRWIAPEAAAALFAAARAPAHMVTKYVAIR